MSSWSPSMSLQYSPAPPPTATPEDPAATPSVGCET